MLRASEVDDPLRPKVIRIRMEPEMMLYFVWERSQDALNNMDMTNAAFDVALKPQPQVGAIDHEINTRNETPSNRNAYPLSVIQLEEQTRQINILLSRGLIQDNTSRWAAPVLFVHKPKSLGEWRMCIDYRALKQNSEERLPPTTNTGLLRSPRKG